MHSLPIAHHEQKYLITSGGNVISRQNNNILVPRLNPNGYLIVTLSYKQLSIHRLVAKHFLPNPYNHDYVNHLDGDKQNNNVTNLEWCTAERNANHALEIGLRSGFVSYDTKLALLDRVLRGELIADVANDLPETHPNTLSKMLRITAKKEGLENDWKEAMKIRRRDAAIRNLAKINY